MPSGRHPSSSILNAKVGAALEHAPQAETHSLSSCATKIAHSPRRFRHSRLKQVSRFPLTRVRTTLNENRLHRVNDLASSWYHERLKASEGVAALTYLARRGISSEMTDAFQIGYSPDNWDRLKTYFAHLGVPDEDSVDAGLVYRREEDGRSWDFFRGRLMFPIHDRKQNIIGFGGRQLTEPAPESSRYNPKYINTAANPVFDKQSSLYGIHRAHAAIRDSDTAIVVEGFMDVITAHQYGFTNVVASMGTALTENQVAQLKSLATNFILALDADTAGQEATLRSLETSWKVIGNQPPKGRSQGILRHRAGITISVAELPEGQDPDSLIRHTPEEWIRLMKDATPLMSYLIPAIAARVDTSSGEGKSHVVDAVFPLIAATSNPFDQQRYLKELADALGITLDALRVGLPRSPASRNANYPRRNRQAATPQVTESAFRNREDVLDNFLLSLLLKSPQLRDKLDGFSPDHLHNSSDREIFTLWLECADPSELEDRLEPALQPHFHALMEEANSAPMLLMTVADCGKALEQCVNRIKERYQKQFQMDLLVMTSADPSAPPPMNLRSRLLA